MVGEPGLERVYQKLRSAILGGYLAPGQWLEPAELGRRFEVSVDGLWGALERLADEGLVRPQEKRGFTVTPFMIDDIVDLAAARADVEVMVLRHSVRDGDAGWHAAVEAWHHTLARTPMTTRSEPTRLTEPWIVAHDAFHLTLLSGCRNRRLLNIASSLRVETGLHRRWSVSCRAAPERDVGAEHRALAEAATARDEDLAAGLLGEHIAHTAQALVTRSNNNVFNLGELDDE